MISRLKHVVPAVVFLLACTAVPADDLTGSDRFLCSGLQVTRCLPDGECESGLPWMLNVPQFILVDLNEKTLSTTEASGENRSSPFKNLEREESMIYLQGVEGGRAFSFVIAEETGLASIAVAMDGASVAAFAACTPMAPAR